MALQRSVALCVLALASACTAGLAVSGCKTTPATVDAGDAGAVATPGGLTPEQAAQVLAKVGDRTITLGQFAETIAQMDQFDRMRYQAPERRKELLNEMIDTMLLADDAREAGYDQNTQTQQEIRQALRDALLKEEREGIPSPNDIPDADVKAYFDAHKADFHDPERRRVATIVFASQPAAAAAIASLKGAGAIHWGDMVRKQSLDAHAKAADVPIDLAGDLGFVAPPDDPRGGNVRIPQEVRAAVFSIDAVGGIDPAPVEAKGRYYVVKLTGKTPPHDRTLADVERTIRVRLSQDRLRDAESKLLDQLQKQWPVRFVDAGMESVQVELPPPSVDGGSASR